MEFKSVFLVSVIFMFSAVSVDALICFICSGVNDGPCFGPDPTNVTSVICEDMSGSSDIYVCFTVKGTTANIDIVNRGCMARDLVDTFCAEVTTIANVECTSCDTDLCNF